MNKYWLQPKKSILKDLVENVLSKDQEGMRRVFIDRGSKILFVAHLDTVLMPKFVKRTKNRIYATGLDDRLGCKIAFELSKELGADLLLTDHEEKCASTARYHECKEYNWIAEFDRAGDDVVTYNLDNDEFRKQLKEFWRIGVGSFSDISCLKTDACCVNIGIGYEKAHDKDSYVNLKVMQKQIAKFKMFFEQNKNISYKHDKPEWECDSYWFEDLCELCGLQQGEYVYGRVICEYCFHELLRQEYFAE